MTTISLPRQLPSRHHVADLQRRFPLFQVAVLVVLYVIGAATVPGWTTHSTLMSMLVMAALLGLAGAGQTIVVLGGGIDFSVGAFITAGAVFITELTSTDHWPMWAATASTIQMLTIGGIGIPNVRVVTETAESVHDGGVPLTAPLTQPVSTPLSSAPTPRVTTSGSMRNR